MLYYSYSSVGLSKLVLGLLVPGVYELALKIFSTLVCCIRSSIMCQPLFVQATSSIQAKNRALDVQIEMWLGHIFGRHDLVLEQGCHFMPHRGFRLLTDLRKVLSFRPLRFHELRGQTLIVWKPKLKYILTCDFDVLNKRNCFGHPWRYFNPRLCSIIEIDVHEQAITLRCRHSSKKKVW